VKTTDFYDLMNTEIKCARTKWAEKLGVSTSGYYAWLNERKRRQADDDARRGKVIAVFNEGQGVYGVDLICGILRRDGDSASYLVVKRIMSQEGLKSCHCRRRQRSLTDSRKSRGAEYKNLTIELEITRPFQIISSDISYIRTGEGFDYLCQIRDVCNNTVLASCQAENMKKEIVHWRFYPTREAARQAIFEYIEVFYNRHRLQKRLGYLSPIQFLNAWNKRTLPCSA
jgi:putative transposase